MEKDGAKYFGPYIGATAVKQVIDAVRDVFPLRTCKLALPLKSPRRPCVNYEIGRCLARAPASARRQSTGICWTVCWRFWEGITSGG